jgi:hypothetical protein|eukprot:SAG25_NODE_2763_length_1397_cov_1.365177_1_plen_103_part_00
MITWFTQRLNSSLVGYYALSRESAATVEDPEQIVLTCTTDSWQGATTVRCVQADMTDPSIPGTPKCYGPPAPIPLTGIGAWQVPTIFGHPSDLAQIGVPHCD